MLGGVRRNVQSSVRCQTHLYRMFFPELPFLPKYWGRLLHFGRALPIIPTV